MGWEGSDPGAAVEQLIRLKGDVAGRQETQGLRLAQGQTFPSIPCSLCLRDLKGCMYLRQKVLAAP